MDVKALTFFVDDLGNMNKPGDILSVSKAYAKDLVKVGLVEEYKEEITKSDADDHTDKKLDVDDNNTGEELPPPNIAGTIEE